MIFFQIFVCSFSSYNQDPNIVIAKVATVSFNTNARRLA